MVPFRDRADAGRKLAKELAGRVDRETIVVALPRGGVVVGYHVARALGLPLDIMLVRKLGAPFNPELGVGAIAEGGVRILDDAAIEILALAPSQVEAIEARERVELERRSRTFRGEEPPLRLARKTVVLVDDGVATGGTARAATEALRRRGVARIILAVPVGPPDTLEALKAETDEVVCLLSPPDFTAVGEWYDRFPQTSDEEVVGLLRDARRGHDQAGGLTEASAHT